MPRPLAGVSMFLVVTSLGAATFTVTSTSDSGAGTLRQAILDANANPGNDTIAFAIPGSGVHTISVTSALTITDSVLIDGYAQPGSSPNTDPLADNAVIRIELAGSGTDGLVVTGGAAQVQGLALYGFQNAVHFASGGPSFLGGSFVGLNAAGQPTAGNVGGVWAQTGDGIGVTAVASRNVVSGNVVGIQTDGGVASIVGNLIGTDLSGSVAVPNGTGVMAATTIQLSGRNVISGNTGDGVHITGGSPFVSSNLIGLDTAAIHALGNGGVGIYASGVSDTPTFSANYVSGNSQDGIYITNSFTVYVYNNHLGLNLVLAGVGTGGAGIHTSGTYAVVGPDASPGNIIAANREGIWNETTLFPFNYQAEGNAIFQNEGRGIVVGPVPEVPPNGTVLNFPLITTVVPNATTTSIQGIYRGPPDASVTFDLYSNLACDKKWPWQFDEGRNWLGSTGGHTDANGFTAFSATVPVVLSDEVVTATATFSVCVPNLCVAGGTPPPPTTPEGGFEIWTQTSGLSQRLPWKIAPASGNPAGGDPVVITGSSLADAATVTIGSAAPGNVTYVSPFEIDATTPALPPGTVADITVVNPDGSHGTLPMGFLADFSDVPPAHIFHDYVRTLVTNGVAAGVGGGNYGVDQSALREQMAVFLLKAKHGICFTPVPCIGAFADVPCTSPYSGWIEQLLWEGITGGCGNFNFCPKSPVRRDQMAAFLLKAEHGSSYLPPACAGVFADVACPSVFADWIEQFAAEGITGGCGGGNYCPQNANTRGQMAVFLVKTFGLQ